MTTTQSNELATFAHELADAARDVLRKRFRNVVESELKEDESPVTAVDREVEELLRARIRSRFPEHGIVGEEFGTESLEAEHVWILDPIDGTKAFASGKPLFGTLIGLFAAGRPKLGVIECPATEDRWIGIHGAGAFFNGEPCRVRAPRTLDQSVLYTIVLDQPGYRALAAASRWTVHDADCYAYGLVANGTVDVVVEAGLGLYDVCALAPVVSEAGGVIRQWDGEPVRLSGYDGTIVAASSEALAAEALATLGS